eukprot:scaffold5096_cov222-Prasinococcus_capsulatus_cf.AAC.2
MEDAASVRLDKSVLQTWGIPHHGCPNPRPDSLPWAPREADSAGPTPPGPPRTPAQKIPQP